MLKANPTIFKFYLAMLEYFSEYLSGKYSESSLDNPNHYKTFIIQKIVRMFRTLDELTKDSKDEVSARCVLRGILDSVTTYCFIYEREDKSEILFRHYLYELDGLKTYKNAIVDGVLEDGNNKPLFDDLCHMAIAQLKKALSIHPYANLNNRNVDTIVKNNNWKYRSLDNPKSLTFSQIYKHVLLNDKLVNYYQKILSQYSHGLCLSNTPYLNAEQMQTVLFECIPLAERMVQGICETFSKKELVDNFRHSGYIKKIVCCQDFNYDELFEFAEALLRKDKILSL